MEKVERLSANIIDCNCDVPCAHLADWNAYQTARGRLRDLSPDLARLAVAAGELAEAVGVWSEHDGDLGYSQVAYDVIDALTRFRAIAEGKE